MPVALIDTSALVKRYRTAEKGADTVQSLFSNTAYSKTIISLSIVEFLNTFYRLKREDHITKQTLTETIDSLYADIFFGTSLFIPSPTRIYFLLNALLKKLIRCLL